MFKYIVLLALAVGTIANVPCCKEKQTSTTYLDIASNLIAMAKSTMPECKDNKEKRKCPDTQAKATDCVDWYNEGHRKSGVYTIWPVNRLTFNKSVDVFCDMETDGGGWTVIQRRGNFGSPDDYFYKDWIDYKNGFGNIENDFWIGNDNIFALTNQKPYSIRFDLEDEDNKKAYAKYSVFRIDDEYHKYHLHISGYSGNAAIGRNGMVYHNNCNFTTRDQKNEVRTNSNCAKEWKGGWWYKTCYRVHLNGIYNKKPNGINWNTWHPQEEASLILTEMKVRPTTFTPGKYFSFENGTQILGFSLSGK